MKNLAILALIFGFLSSAAHAESAVSEAPGTTLAMNNIAIHWAGPAEVIDNTDTLAKEVEQKAAKTIKAVNVALSKTLEDKIARELEYAMP